MLKLLYSYYVILRNYKSFSDRVYYSYLITKFKTKMFFDKSLNLNIRKEKLFGRNLKFQTYEQFHVAFFDIFIEKQHEIKLENRKPVIFDCGANYGLSTIYFKKFYPNAKVHVFEPDEDNFKDLTFNLNGLKDVKIHKKAVSEKSGKIKFYKDNSKALTGGSMNKSFGKGTEIEIETTSIPDVKEKKIDYLKLDIEGSEGKVLKSMINSKIDIKYIFLEYHYQNIESKTNNKFSDIFLFLERNNYNYIIESRARSPFRKDVKAYGSNIFAVKRED